MSFNRRTVIILVAALVILILGVVVFNLLGEEEYAEDVVKILGADTDIAWVNIDNSYGEYTVTKQDDDYAIEDMGAGIVNTGLADNLFYALKGLKSIAVCEQEESIMGLESPVAVVTFGAGSEQNVLKIGRKSERYDGYYVAYNDDAIYIIEAYIADLFFLNVDEYRDNQFFRFDYESDYDKLEYVSVDGADIIPMEFVRENEDFYMVKPVHHLCSQREVRLQLLDPIMHLAGDEYVGSVETEQMGFDTAEYSIRIEYDGQTYNILVGSVLGQKRYVTVEDSNAIYLIDETKLEFLRIDYRQAIGGNIYSRPIDDVEKFTIESNGESYEFDIERSAKGLVIKHNGVEYSRDDVLPVYNRITGLNMFKILGENISSENEIVTTIALRNGYTDVVMLSKINEREYSVNVNGDCVFSTTAVIVEEMLDRLSDY